MRDLGLMGESTFSLWCGDVGLIPNGSRVDKTGWDFYVEFPFDPDPKLPVDMQGPPTECKVQVKATDKKNRKLQIKLSNLRRLIMAPLPTFILFMEFESTDSVKSAFLVHVDNELIDKVLTRLRFLEQKENKTDFNKRTILIKYDESNKLETNDGEGLRVSILKNIPNGLDQYVSDKSNYLQSTGFENGFATINFKTTGISSLKDLIDVSIGKKEHAEVEGFTGHHVRFGISDKRPFVDCETGKISMPDIKPNSKGIIRFRDNKLSPSVSFEVNLYISPLNIMLDESLKTMRVEGEFFDLVLKPFTGKADYSFSFGEGVRLKIDKFRDALKLFSKLSTAGNKTNVEMEFDDYPLFEFSVSSGNVDINFDKEILVLESAIEIANYFEIINEVDISFNELKDREEHIIQYRDLIEGSADKISTEFSVKGDGFDSTSKVCTLFFMSLPFGSHVVGIIVSLHGYVNPIPDNRFSLNPTDMVVEHKVVAKRGDSAPDEELKTLLKLVEKKYDKSGLSVVTMQS